MGNGYVVTSSSCIAGFLWGSVVVTAARIVSRAPCLVSIREPCYSAELDALR